MARFFLHLYNRVGPVPDEEGTEASDLSAARELAIASVRDILSEEAKEGRIDFGGRIEITDADQNLLLVVPFSEAVEFRPGGDEP